MHLKNFVIFSLLFYFMLPAVSLSQDDFGDIEDETIEDSDSEEGSASDGFGDEENTLNEDITLPSSTPVFKEEIKKISKSKKIFILSNEAGNLSKGDFISFLKNDQLVSRALVAKISNDLVGVKIIKIYSRPLWATLKEKKEVKIIRGDDSYYINQLRAKKTKKKKKRDKTEIKSEEDLFNETAINDDLELKENGKRGLKNDNLISVSYGRVEGIDEEGSSTTYGQFSAQWSHQLHDDIFIEASFGQNLVKDFPSKGLDTKLTNLTFRGKYSFNGPVQTFLKPYLGYQIINVDSPGAGEDESGGTDATTLAQEKERLKDMEKKALIFGVTVLKRLVPGWFIRADLGTDIISFGFALEF